VDLNTNVKSGILLEVGKLTFKLPRASVKICLERLTLHPFRISVVKKGTKIQFINLSRNPGPLSLLFNFVRQQWFPPQFYGTVFLYGSTDCNACLHKLIKDIV